MGVIDKADVQYSDVPDSLAGDVLLERQYDAEGRMCGVITATLMKCLEMKNKTDSELESEGWLKYKPILMSLPD